MVKSRHERFMPATPSIIAHRYYLSIDNIKSFVMSDLRFGGGVGGNSVRERNRARLFEVLLFVVERLAVRAYLDFRFLPVGIDLGLVGDQRAFFGERLHFQDLPLAGFGLKTGFHVRG